MVAFLAVFTLLTAVYIFVGLKAQRYTPRLRALLVGLSACVPLGILLSWQFI